MRRSVRVCAPGALVAGAYNPPLRWCAFCFPRTLRAALAGWWAPGSFRVVPERSELCCARAPGKRQHTLPYGAVCDVGLRRSAHIRCLQALCGPAALEQKLSGCALTLRAP